MHGDSYSVLWTKTTKKHKNRKYMVPFTSFIRISESLPGTAYLQ